MEYEQFRNEIKERIGDFLAGKYEGAEVSINEVVKNNDQHLYGLTIKTTDKNIAPTIYLESFYEDYENGKYMDDILENIMKIREEYDTELEFDVNNILDVEKVRDKISCRLVGMENNAEYLAGRPYDKVSDLAVIYCIKVDEIGNGSIPITNQLLENLGISHEELHDIALENLQKEDVSFRSMRDVLMGMMSNYGEPEAFLGEENPMLDESMYVLSNKEYTNGAVAILNTAMMDKVAEKFGGDVIVLPSSTHELIILKKTEDMDREVLEDMVRSINATEVRPEEKLSDHVYVYHAETHELLRADEFEKAYEQIAENTAQYEVNTGDIGVSEAGTEYQTSEKISITFAKGLVGEPFLGKDGNGYREIKIPNVDENDKRPWQSFVVKSDQIRENENGKSVWIRLSKDGETSVGRSVRVGEDENGKGIYENQREKVPNVEIKKQLENYRTKDREASKDTAKEAQSVAQERPAYEPKEGRKKTSVKDMIAKNKVRSAENPTKKQPSKNREEALA